MHAGGALYLKIALVHHIAPVAWTRADLAPIGPFLPGSRRAREELVALFWPYREPGWGYMWQLRSDDTRRGRWQQCMHGTQRGGAMCGEAVQATRTFGGGAYHLLHVNYEGNADDHRVWFRSRRNRERVYDFVARPWLHVPRQRAPLRSVGTPVGVVLRPARGVRVTPAAGGND